MREINLRDALNRQDRRLLNEPVDVNDVSSFKEIIKEFTNKVNQADDRNENEEYFKRLINDFLEDNLYYDDRFTINTYRGCDSAIRENNNIACIIEVKKPQNTSEMLSRDNLNKKAFWELIYYYLEETRNTTSDRIRRNQDAQVRNLIATDSINWFIIDSNEIERIINNDIENFYYQFKNGQLNGTDTAFMYEKIKQFISENNLNDDIEFIYINMREICNQSSLQISYVYKVLSKYYLLKERFSPRTGAHSLNKKFYQELLYILGLKEYAQNSKKLIKLDMNIENSIGVQTYQKLIDDGFTEDKAIDETFELLIIWIDRLLFVKLFEGQLIAFNEDSDDFHILDNEKIKTFSDVENLFFNVLGKKNNERATSEFYRKFSEVPYLNSSLFELQDAERSGIRIALLENSNIKIKGDSILFNDRNRNVPLLTYLIDFLNNYDFGIKELNDNVSARDKDIIDASVLGLIFEKINGYKDGSVYTPSQITEFMAKKVVESNIIKKINFTQNWTENSIEELSFKIRSNSSRDLYLEINNAINSITYCDPAVGSGHFLVSLLNQIIAIKYQLGILTNHVTNQPVNEYEIYVENDTLIIKDALGNDFCYDKTNVASQNMQETLFFEKRIIIEKCLFGVDVNEKAVHICQLRLWIELLKSAYYKDGIMQTLPNIDINIKCGNSCVYRLPFDVDSDETLNQKLGIDSRTRLVRSYKEAAKKYILEDNKEAKKQLVGYFNEINDFYIHPFDQISLINEEQNQIDIHNRWLYKNSLEWAIQFPEILDDEGRFLGFDTVIGNPPYISMEALHDDSPRYRQMNYEVYESNTDIYCLFFELAKKLIKNQGTIAFITSNKWMRAGYGRKTRKFLSQKLNPYMLINFGGIKVFKEANVDTNILFINNERYDSTIAVKTTKNCLNYLNRYINENSRNIIFDENNWVVMSETDEKIKSKIDTEGQLLSEWNVSINMGIKTGLNRAFIIDETRRQTLISLDDRINNLVKPILRGRDIKKFQVNFANLWLICTHNGYGSVSRIDVDDFPSLKQYFDDFGDALSRRTDQGDTKYNLRNCAYMGDFNKEKIIYPETTLGASFYYDNNGMYIDKTAFMITGEHLKYIMATLSSSLFEYAYKNLYSNIELGSNGYQYNKEALLKVPIYSPTEQEESHIIQIIDRILDNRNEADIRELNTAIFKLYNISEEEISYINMMLE